MPADELLAVVTRYRRKISGRKSYWLSMTKFERAIKHCTTVLQTHEAF